MRFEAAAAMTARGPRFGCNACDGFSDGRKGLQSGAARGWGRAARTHAAVLAARDDIKWAGLARACGGCDFPPMLPGCLLWTLGGAVVQRPRHVDTRAERTPDSCPDPAIPLAYKWPV